MTYTHKSNHYRVLPNIGSEHKRRLAANDAAAQRPQSLSITDIGVERTSDVVDELRDFRAIDIARKSVTSGRGSR